MGFIFLALILLLAVQALILSRENAIEDIDVQINKIELKKKSVSHKLTRLGVDSKLSKQKEVLQNEISKLDDEINRIKKRAKRKSIFYIVFLILLSTFLMLLTVYRKTN